MKTKIKNKFLKKFAACLLLCAVLFSCASCGAKEPVKMPNLDLIVTGYEEPEPRTLVVAAANNIMPFAPDFAAGFMAENPHVTVVVEFYDDPSLYRKAVTDSLDPQSDHIIDLFEGYGLGVHNPGMINRLTDFMPIMRDDPTVDLKDYNMNAVYAMMHDYGVYEFPFMVEYSFMTVDRTRTELVEMYKEHETVNIFDLLRMYGEYKNIYMSRYQDGVFGSENTLFFEWQFDPFFAVYRTLGSFIDFDSNTCNFNSQKFIKLVTDAKNATNMDDWYKPYFGINMTEKRGWAVRTTQPYHITLQEHFFTSYIYFQNHMFSPPYTYWATYDVNDRRAVHLKPYSNEAGQLSVEVTKSFCISDRSQNKDLAWEFMKYMMDPENHAVLNSGIFNDSTYYYLHALIWGIPTYKPLTDRITEVVGYEDLRKVKILSGRDETALKGTVSEQIEIVKSEINILTDYPVYYVPLFRNEYNILFDHYYHEVKGNIPLMNDRVENILQIISRQLYMYQVGQINAEQAAELIQEKVSEIFSEQKK
ncbi:MAG: hypothetical protein FWE82_08605 [Defluviitaleaceae bacterium]|nr:hypothetical protein [Defluviitaleaceae bacterium]